MVADPRTGQALFARKAGRVERLHPENPHLSASNAMKTHIAILSFRSLLLPLFLLSGLAVAHAQTKNVYVIEISEEVDKGLGPYVERVIAEADKNPGSIILLHVDTFGGEVAIATQIKDAVIDAKAPTIAFVDKRAISAGALITLSADKIAMAPGSSIGAATPVYQTGEKASEKVVSYMRGEMRATAERTGRNPMIAEAMVDEELTLADSGLKQAGKLLTLTTAEAMRVGYCDAEAENIQEALGAFGYTDVTIIQGEMNWAESLVRILTSPFISSLLIMLGLGGLFYGIKTGHFGAVAILGVSSIALFFGAQYLVDLANALEIAMFVFGVVLLLVEIFVIPGFGVVGVSGIVLLMASLFLALIGNFDLISMDSLTAPLYTLAGAMLGLGVLVWMMIKYLPNSSSFRRFVLYGESVGGDTFSEAEESIARLLGEGGEAMTTLRPAGIATIRGERVDVVSSGEFIPAGTPVRVVYVEGRKVVVERMPKEQ